MKQYPRAILFLVIFGVLGVKSIFAGDSTSALGNCTTRAGELICGALNDLPTPEEVQGEGPGDMAMAPPASKEEKKPKASANKKEESKSGHPRLLEVSHTVISSDSEEVTLRLDEACDADPKVGSAETQSKQIVYFDFEGMTFDKKVKGHSLPKGGIVKGVRLGRHGGNTPKTRVSIDLPKSKDISYTHHPLGSLLVIRLYRAASAETALENINKQEELKAVATSGKSIGNQPPVAIPATKTKTPAEKRAEVTSTTAKEEKSAVATEQPRESQKTGTTPPINPALNTPPPLSVPQWTLKPGDTIGRSLQTWADKAGWKVIWNMPKDWSVPATTVFHGDFQSAAEQVIQALAANGALVKAQFYTGNNTLVVSGPGDSAQ